MDNSSVEFLIWAIWAGMLVIAFGLFMIYHELKRARMLLQRAIDPPNSGGMGIRGFLFNVLKHLELISPTLTAAHSEELELLAVQKAMLEIQRKTQKA